MNLKSILIQSSKVSFGFNVRIANRPSTYQAAFFGTIFPLHLDPLIKKFLKEALSDCLNSPSGVARDVIQCNKMTKRLSNTD